MICIPIAGTQTPEVIEKIRRASLLADIIELRIDRIPGADLGRLLAARHTPVIVTNRCRKEGGGFVGTEEERVELLKEAVRLGADYIDIEAATDPALKKGLRETLVGSSSQLIVSWHDFSGTPSAEFLKAKLTGCMADGPAIVKIVTHAAITADCLRLLELIPYARQRDQAIIAFCMGRPGKISRIMAPMLGSVFSYASLEPEEASAPGQMTIHQMREIYRIMDERQSNE
ncbi:MAG: type I 3-dehydroquinate dehydratase [Syntrophus sp. (in: bacteria)]|nr:type I 3-dehydroquinate dehydratase [Syntrophus sp. (in: bacteria)]